MAAAPQWKVYDSHSKYQASCHEIEAAAALMGFYGNGATIRWGHSVKYTVWTEGLGQAAQSYDDVARVAWEHVDRWTTRYGQIQPPTSHRGSIEA